MNEMARLAADRSDDFRARFTTAEFEWMCVSGAFDDMKVELVDGELERMQSPMNMHAMRQAKIVFLLALAVGVERVRGAVGIDLASNTVLECDAAVLRQPVAENRRLVAADVALAVEIAETTLNRDLGMKRRKYASAGVPHYWVVNGGAGVTHVFSDPRSDAYVDETVIAFDQPLTVPETVATITID